MPKQLMLKSRSYDPRAKFTQFFSVSPQQYFIRSLFPPNVLMHRHGLYKCFTSLSAEIEQEEDEKKKRRKKLCIFTFLKIEMFSSMVQFDWLFIASLHAADSLLYRIYRKEI